MKRIKIIKVKHVPEISDAIDMYDEFGSEFDLVLFDIGQYGCHTLMSLLEFRYGYPAGQSISVFEWLGLSGYPKDVIDYPYHIVLEPTVLVWRGLYYRPGIMEIILQRQQRYRKSWDALFEPLAPETLLSRNRLVETSNLRKCYV